jgi:tetratricopeptide (TPR) repeat protein
MVSYHPENDIVSSVQERKDEVTEVAANLQASALAGGPEQTTKQSPPKDTKAKAKPEQDEIPVRGMPATPKRDDPLGEAGAEKSENDFKKLVQEQRKKDGKDTEAVAERTKNLAEYYEKKKDLPKAKIAYSEVAKIYEKVLGPNDLKTGIAIYDVARIEALRKNFKEASPLCERAIKIAQLKNVDIAKDGTRKVNDQARSLYVGSLRKHAEVLNELGLKGQAEAQLKRAGDNSNDKVEIPTIKIPGKSK